MAASAPIQSNILAILVEAPYRSAALHASISSVYPEPQVPKNPVLGWAAFQYDNTIPKRDIPNILDLPHIRHVTSARIAIAWALQKMNIGTGDEVLIPDYHCLSMVEPVHWSGATARYYSLTDRLVVDLDDLAKSDLSRVKAILVTHFFGFPQPMHQIQVFCRARGIRIIEDCAHALFGTVDGQPIGSWGEFAAVSLMKFFPVYEGGCLASASHDLSDVILKPASLRFQTKSFLNGIERGLYYQRFPGIQLLSKLSLHLKDSIWDLYKYLRFGPKLEHFRFRDPASSEGSSGLDARWLDRSMSIPSLLLLRFLPMQRVITRRQNHYRRLQLELQDLPGVKPLFPNLPDDVVPYVFPLLVERPETIFEPLKKLGFPLFRWDSLSDELDASVHTRALNYATSLFQIPCHQELTDDDMTWMIHTLQTTIKSKA